MRWSPRIAGGVACATIRESRIPSVLALASVVAIVALVGARRAEAATLSVCPSGCPYTQIAPALAAAQSGDTIKIGAGRYSGGLTINLDVTLVGAGVGETIIKGGNTVLTIGAFGATTEPTVSIDGVTITGGVARTSPESIPFTGLAGVFALGGGIEIPQNAAGNGGATVTIDNSAITNNSAIPSNSDPHVNPFAGGGGIDNWGTLTITNTTVTDNRAGGSLASGASGGGIFSWTDLKLRKSVVNDNHAIATGPSACFTGGGGIESFGKIAIGVTSVSDNTVELSSSSNCGESQGGGIFVQDGGSATINRAMVRQNRVTASSAGGDAIAYSGGIADYGTLSLQDSTIEQNRVSATTTAASGTANPAAGGIGIVFPNNATISNTSVTGNEVGATATSGVAAASAGAIQTPQTTLSNSLISDNRVTASSQTGSATVHGAGIEHGNGLLEIRNTTITNNTANATGPTGQALGGGIWNDVFFPPPPNPRLILENTTVTDNALTASPGITVHGGGVFTTFPVILDHSTITHNTPDDCFGQSC
jgi:hypothetical protein